MFSNNINDMIKKTIKTIKTIKEELEINSKKEAVETFGLSTNISTKDYNKYLRKYYNKIVKNINENIKEQNKTLSKNIISKMAQTIKGKKITQRRINIRKAINNLDKEQANFTNIVPSELKLILNQLQKIKGRVVLKIGGKHITITPVKLNQMIEYLEDFYVFNDGVNDGSDIETIVNNILNSLEVSIYRPKWLGKDVNNGGFFKYYNLTGIDLTPYAVYNSKQETYPENCLIQSLITFGLDSKIITQIRNIVIPSNPNEASFKYIPTNKLTKIAEEFKLFIVVKKPEEGETRKSKNTQQFPTNIKTCPDGWIQINLGLIDNHYFLNQQIPINQYAVKNYFAICNKKDYHLFCKKDEREKRYTTSFKCIDYMFKNKDLYLKEIPYEDLLDSQYHDLAKEIKCLDFDISAIKENSDGEIKQFHKKFINIFFDFETITTDKHIPYMVNMSYDNKTFHGERCGYDMLKYLYDNIYSKDPTIVIKLIAHNAGYDYAFIQKYLTISNLIKRGHHIMSAQGIFWGKRKHGMKVLIQDSYSIITMPLSQFPKAFNLEGKKEIIPYKLYTEENVNKKYILVKDLRPYCIQQVKEKNIGFNTTTADYDNFENELIKNADEWKCLSNDKLKIDIIKYSQMYCERDVEVLKQGWNVFAGYLNELECNIDDYISSAQFADNYMKKNDVFEDVYMLSSTPRDFIMKSMVGGRTMCCENKKQYQEGIIDDFDAVSLYPSAMKRLGGYLKGIPRQIENNMKNMSFLNSCDGYFIRIKINKVNIHRKFPLISYINEQGIRTWTNEPIDFVYCGKIALEDFIKFQGIEFDIIDGYYYNEGRNINLSLTIDSLFEKRKIKKREHNKVEQIYKLIMNSAYGKTLMKAFETDLKFKHQGNIEEFIDKNYNMIKYFEEVECDGDFKKYIVTMDKTINKHFNNAPCGVEVLEMSKRIMNEVMCLAEDLGIDIYYQDTDSMHIRQEGIKVLAKEYALIYGRELIGKCMGQFHTDFDSNIIDGEIHARKHIALGKKCYIDELFGKDKNGNDVIDYHIRMKGVPNSSVLHKALNELNVNGLPRGVMDIFENMYKGNSEVFDLKCGGYKINFIHNGDFSISTQNDKYERELQFI